MEAQDSPVCSTSIDLTDERAIDDQVALRSWAGQHHRAAAQAMGISAARFRSRRRRLEIPQLARNGIVQEFDPERAKQTIKTLRYRKVQCRAYKARGIEFFFWRPERELRWHSRRAQSTTWFRKLVADATGDPGAS